MAEYFVVGFSFPEVAEIFFIPADNDLAIVRKGGFYLRGHVKESFVLAG